jgi:hypothetical protein
MKIARIAWAATLLWATSAHAASSSAGAYAPALPDIAMVEGISQSELTNRWWQWAGSFEYADSPVSDATGERCGAGQEGPVWFLAGTYGSMPAKRTCKVPADKYLFFPLINYIVMPRMCGQCSCDQVVATAHEVTNGAMGLFTELDGRALGALNEHRVASNGCFNVAGRIPNGPKIEPAASDGYWLLIPPLPKGKHTLRFGGSLPSLRQELIYTLIVE